MGEDRRWYTPALPCEEQKYITFTKEEIDMRITSMFTAFVLACGLALPSFVMAEEASQEVSSEAKQEARIPQAGPAVISKFSPAGGAFKEGAFAAMVNYSYAEKDSYYSNGSKHSSYLNGRNTQNIVNVKFRYGFGDGWDIRSATPIISNFIENDKATTSKNGVGDTFLILRRQLFSQEEGYAISFAAGLGAVIPTGSTSSNGIGNGAWGLIPEIGATYKFDGGRQLIEGGMTYIWCGKNQDVDNDIDVADMFRVHARYVYALDHNWDLGVEAQYEYTTQSVVDDVNKHNANSTLFAGPAVTYKIPAWKASLGLSAQIGLYQDYQDYNSSLAEECRIEMKLIKVF